MPSKKATTQKSKGTKLIYTFKSDVLFKMLFVRHPNLLKRLVAVLLGISLKSIKNFQTINTEMPPEEIGKKFCRLDINMMVDGKRVNLEIQIEDEGNYPERSMFHWAKMFTSSLPAGNDYSLLPKTIVISILGFKQFDCKEVHSEFASMEINRHEILSDKQRYHFFELPKLPDVDSIDTTSEKNLWLALFNAETEEELEKLIVKGGEVMNQAVEAYRGITATDEFKYLEVLRARTKHDEAQAINNAKKQGAEAEREHWQCVVAEKDTALAEQAALIAKLQAQIKNQ
ncbi:MAG: Rpn family recombination-promoting nuclease/putative transposase [Defluviitaleaceae bacterium]|nr:Rpn family recombination-promoting nuclease/putative transposase [Defluviitaleaceae bacterium]